MEHRPPQWLVLTVVAFGVFVAADDLTVVTTMLRSMISDFDIALPGGFDEAAWIVDSYLIAYVAVMPFAGRVSDLFGRRRVYVSALGLFAVGSMVIAVADSYSVLLVGRVLSAIGGGALVPVGLAVVADLYPPAKRASALGVLAAVDTMGWVWGPMFGAFLIRFLSWRWQFYLNVPLALVGLVAAWIVLRHHDSPTQRGRVDWVGAGSLTVGLVALNVALLESSEIQSVSGLDELTGEVGYSTLPFWALAIAAIGLFVWWERRASSPTIDLGLFSRPNLSVALGVNFLAGAALIIAMVDVPLFVNVIESEEIESALASGRVLSALTIAMALFAYFGGRTTDRVGYRRPTVVGLGLVAVAFLIMGFSWDADVGFGTMAWQLAILGVGFGLMTAPTNAAAVSAASEGQRGSAAALVIVARLTGLAVGLSGLTAWGLHRFNVLRQGLDLPPLSDPGYQDALSAAQVEVTSTAIAETFLAAALVAALGVVLALALRRDSSTV
ncbi:MAG: MFS transporter [Acidimicrobiia bacterium]|nr:MFS transporter [Acidimicrobiia bacterium]